MTAKRLLILLIFLQIFTGIGWYLGFYQPYHQKMALVQRQLDESLRKLSNANHAKIDLKNIEARLNREKQNLADIKSHFIYKTELARVTEDLRRRAEKFDLVLTDFAPVLDNYFVDTLHTEIKPLPLAITVTGKYLDIGRYIESWDQLPFYILPNEIKIEKLDEKSNDLQATVTGNLYAWNKAEKSEQ